MNETKNAPTSTSTAKAPEGDKPTEQKRLTIGELLTDLVSNKPHGKDVNAYLVERFIPLLDKAKGFNAIRMAVLLHLIAESFPKHVWDAIAASGDPKAISDRVRVAVRAMQKEKAKILASFSDNIGTDLDLLYLAVDERQNVPGKLGGAEWAAYFLNVSPDKKTQKQLALCQLDPSRAKTEAAATPGK